MALRREPTASTASFPAVCVALVPRKAAVCIWMHVAPETPFKGKTMPQTILVTRIFPRNYEISNYWCYMGQMTDTVRNFPHSPSVKAPYALSLSCETFTCFVKPRSSKTVHVHAKLLLSSSGCWPGGTSLRMITEYVQPGAHYQDLTVSSFLSMFTSLAQSVISGVSWKFFLENCVCIFQVTAVSAGMINAYLHPISWVEDSSRFESFARSLFICFWMRSVLWSFRGFFS